MEKKLTESLKIIQKDEEVISPASRVPYYPFVMKRGEGATIVDIDGNRYIDFLSSAAALATISVIKEERLVKKSKEMGDYIQDRFNELKKEHELIGDVRGKGLLIGIDLVSDRETKQRAEKEAAKVCWRCWEKGLILTFFSKSVLRIAPPLVITKKEVDLALDIIEKSIKDVEEGKISDQVLEKICGW